MSWLNVCFWASAKMYEYKIFRKTFSDFHFTPWKVCKYGVFSGPYFPHSDWIPENTDQKKLRTIFHTVFYSIFCFSISNHGLPVHTKTWNDLKPSRFRLFLILVSTGTANVIYWRYHESRMNSTNSLVAS